MRQRWALPGLALLAALTLGTGACTTGSGSSGPSAPARTGIEVLTDAAAKTDGQSYQFVVVYGEALTGEGVATGDGAATSMKVTVADQVSGVIVKIDALVLKDATYAKIDLGAASAMLGLSPTTWVHVDPAKAPGAARLGIKPGVDIFGANTYVKGVVTAQANSATDITGTIDLAKTAPPGVASSEIAKLSATQRVVPFTATLDGEGRINKVVLRLPAIGILPAGDLTTTYSNWGATVDATKPPAAQTVEAPALLYTFLS